MINQAQSINKFNTDKFSVSFMISSKEQAWQKVELSIQKILNYLLDPNSQNKVILNNKEYSESYTTIYNLCIQRGQQDHSQWCYEQFKSILQSFFKTKKDSLPNDQDILTQFQKIYKDTQLLKKYLQGLFNYLDRSYLNHNQLPNLYQTADKIFTEHMYLAFKITIQKSYTKSLNQFIQNQTQNDMIINIPVIIKQLSLTYFKEFQQTNLNNLKEEYNNLFNQKKQIYNVKEYIDFVISLSDHQNNLQTLITGMESLFNSIFIASYGLENWLHEMFKQKDLFYLNKVANLWMRLGEELNGIKDIFKSFFQEQGNQALILLEKDMEGGIKELILLYKYAQEIVENVFKKNRYMERAMIEAFEFIVNKNLNVLFLFRIKVQLNYFPSLLIVNQSSKLLIKFRLKSQTITLCTLQPYSTLQQIKTYL